MKSLIELMVPFKKNTAMFESGKKFAIPVLAVRYAEGFARPEGIGTKYNIISMGAANSRVLLRVNLVMVVWIRNAINKNGLNRE